MIALRALGKSEIVTPTDRLTPSQEMMFATGLYLFLERAKPVSRVTLAEALWPGIEDSARQHRLRQTILQLKHAGIPLEANRESVFLPPAHRESDLDVLFLHGAGDIDSLASLQFLPGYAPRFSTPFAHWLDTKRTEVSAATSRLLINDIRKARSRGDWLRLERLAVTCMEVDPFNEEAVLARAEASAMRGAKREAVSILDRYVAELGPGGSDLKLPASLMRKRIAERVPEAMFTSRTEGIFVGREADMHLLTTVLDDARAGKGRCCLLWGDPGIGKSRLGLELGRFGELQGVQVRRVACRRGDAQRPLSVFVEAVPQLREMRGALGCSADTLSDLKRLTQFDIGSASRQSAEMDPQSVFELIRLAIFDLIDAVSEEQCLMLVVEDVQWVDAASARILGQLADWAAKKQLLLLFTSRQRENPLLEACTRAGLVAHHIRPLSNEASLELVREMFDATNEKRDDEFLEWCRQVGDGNPFFLHELVKQWLETKQRHVIPPSLTTVIRERFSRLSSEGTQLLQACSILGENSTLPRVEQMLQQEPYMLLGALNELSKASMLSSERKPAGNSKDFKLAPRHDLVANVALQELDPHAAAFLHRRAAEALEPELEGEIQDTSLLWACALHWQKAGEGDRGYQIGRRYAESLLEVGLPGNAADGLLRLLDFCPTVIEEVQVLELAIPALEAAYRWVEVRRTIARLRDLRPMPPDHDKLEIAGHYALWRLGDHETSLRESLSCARSREASEDHRVHCANLAMRIASSSNATNIMHEIHSVSDTLVPTDETSEIAMLELRTIFHTCCGDLSLAVASVDSVSTACRASGKPSLIARYYTNCATVLQFLGRTVEARELLNEALDELIMARLYPRAKHTSLQIVRLDLLEGETAQAREHFDAVPSEFPPDDVLSGIELEYLHTRLLLAEGNATQAREVLSPFVADINHIPESYIGRILAAAIAVVLSGEPVDWDLDKLLISLEQRHLNERGEGWNDFEAEVLFAGLIARGRRHRAVALANEYVTTFRRDRSPLPSTLAQFTNKRNGLGQRSN